MALEAVDVGRRAGSRWLFKDISCSVSPGDRFALAGLTGTGKTLLLRTLAMLDPVDAGQIRWCGHAVRAVDVPTFRSRVIYLHQRPALREGTVEENLRQPYALAVHQDKQFDLARILQSLKSLGRSADFLAKHQRDLSGGESQLTALLRAMQLDPEILLLDEPTAALDPVATKMVETLVEHWLQQDNQRAVVWVTHDQEQARRVSTLVLQMLEGRLIESVDE